MIICVTSEGNNLNSLVDPRFGRCKFFIFIHSETLVYECVQNPNITATGGVGIKSAQLVSEKKAECVVTGKVGPNAEKALNAANIKPLLNFSGTVREAVEYFNKGN